MWVVERLGEGYALKRIDTGEFVTTAFPTSALANAKRQEWLARCGLIQTSAGIASPNLATTVVTETTFGAGSSAGSSSLAARGDHTHGSPSNPVTSHESTYDHTGFEETANKGAASGYAELDSSALVPVDQLGTGGDGSGTYYLADDQSWKLLATGSGTSLEIDVTQAGHGFAVGDVIRRSSGSYIKAQADSEANAEAIGIVSAVDGDEFTFVAGGLIEGLSGLTDASVYYLSAAAAGALTDTEPDPTTYYSKPLLIATSTTTGIVANMRGLTAAATTLGEDTAILPFEFDDASPATILTVADNYRILSARIDVTTAFDQASTVEIGHTGDADYYLSVDPTTAATYESAASFEYGGADTISLTITPGTSTQGVGVAIVEYEIV